MSIARFDSWVRSTVGPAAAGALVYICTQPTISTSTVPPSPLASLYSNNAGAIPLVNPLVADGFGHAFGYVAAGTYTVVVVIGGVVQQVYADQLIGGQAGAGLTLQTGGSNNTNQSLLNLVGASGISVVNVSGTTTLTFTLALPQTASNTSGQFLNSYDSTTGIFTKAAALVSAPTADQSITAHNLLPNASNTTQSLGVSGAPWNAYILNSTFTGTLTDGSASVGTNGQVLSSTGVGVKWISAASSGFSSLTSGTNSAATMVVGSGASLATSGSGVINASKIDGIAVSGTPSAGQVLTATSSSAADWETPASNAFSSLTGGTNNSGQTFTVGSTSQITYSGSGIINASKIVGVAVGNTPSVGQVLTATSSSGATWQTPASSFKIQAGLATHSGGTATVTFSPAFTTLYSVVGTGIGGSCNVSSASASGVTFNVASVNVYWVAIGT